MKYLMTNLKFFMFGMIGAFIDAPAVYWAALAIWAFCEALWRALENE